MPEIADRLGTSAATIYKDLHLGTQSRRSRQANRRATEVRRLVARGVCKKEIAKRLKVERSLVDRVPHARPLRLTEKVATRVRALRAQGVSKAAIERELKVSKGTVKRALVVDASPVFFRRPGKRHPQRKRALQILDHLAQGVPKAEICRRLHVGWDTIARVVAAENAGTSATVRPRRKTDPVAVRRLWKQGVSKSEIGRRLGISEQTVRRIVGPEPPPIASERVAEIHTLFESGETKTEIARQLHISLGDVYRVLPAEPRPLTMRRPVMPQPQMLPIDEFARALGVDVDVVRAAIEQGEITEVTRLGRQILLPRALIAKLLRAPR